MTNILIFTIATIINVTISTIRSITTIKCGKWISALTNALCYGFYPLIVMLTAKDTVDIIVNMGITAVANFVCVWIIKFVEEKARKDRLWKVEVAIPNTYSPDFIKHIIESCGVMCNYVSVGSWNMFNCYCYTHKQTADIIDIAKHYEGKYSAYESKNLGV